jgi:HipA-like protein
MGTLTAWLKQLWKGEGQESLNTPEDVYQVFVLLYRTHHIGTLTLYKGLWTFAYSEDFKKTMPIHPLSDFSNINRIYESHDLHPFFLQRIPSLEQPKVKRIVEAEKIDVHNEVDLLKRFGRITIANPFVLQPA